MIDVDVIAYLDPTTGLPVVDHRSPAQRWSEALNHGSEQNLSSDSIEPRATFGPVGADPNKQTPRGADGRSNTTNLHNERAQTRQHR